MGGAATAATRQVAATAATRQVASGPTDDTRRSATYTRGGERKESLTREALP